MEDTVLAPFFHDAPAALWPRMILIEDSRHEWKVDLFALFAEKGHAAPRSEQNVVLRREANVARPYLTILTASASVIPSRRNRTRDRPSPQPPRRAP